MATTYATPGVYVEEVSKGTKPIEALGASVAAFVGITKEASRKSVDSHGAPVLEEWVLNKAVLVTNWTQYTAIFGEFVTGAYLPDAVYGYFNNGGGACYVTSLCALNDPLDPDAANEPAAATVSAAGRGSSFTATAKTAGTAGNELAVVVTVDEEDKESFTLAVGDEKHQIKTADFKNLPDFAEDSDETLFSSVTLSKPGSVPPKAGSYALSGGSQTEPKRPSFNDYRGNVEERTGINGLQAIDAIGLLICPDLFANYDGSDEAQEFAKMVQLDMVTHCENMRYCFTILDTPPGLNAQQAIEWKDGLPIDSAYAALYYPWIRVADVARGSGSKLVPPSGHMIGIYNRVDSERGVHKAPANEVVLGALDVELQVSKEEQGQLNPIGVNCIRAFPNRGIRVWGARTLSSDGSWRYINVRRLFNVIGSSLDLGLQWVVFEPNDYTLWGKVRRDVRSFLRTLWLQGALFGATADAAFYVKCDEEINPREIRDLGQLIIEVGVAPVKPAEFVILRLSQWAGPDAEE